MELRALRYFVTVAEELHFGRAAERLHIVQPAVSQQVARLERELGVRLLDRSPRTVRLTEAGQRVLDAAREALTAAERVRTVARQPREEVRIGTARGLTARLGRAIDTLRGHQPEFELVLVDLPVVERLKALRRGDLDLALARGVSCAQGLRVLPAWSEPLHAVVSARHPVAGRETAPLGALSRSVLRLSPREADPPLHDAVVAALRAAGAEPRLGRPTGTVEDTLVEVGSDPASWAVLPAEQLAGTISDRVRVLPVDPPLSVTGVVLTRDDGTAEFCVETMVAAFR